MQNGWPEHPIHDCPPDPSQDELDGLRIRQLAALRRAAYRSRSYCFIAFAAAVVAAIQLIVNAVHHLQWHQSIRRPLLYLCAAITLLVAARFFALLTLKFHREANPPPLPPPTTKPDFSPLGDGSHHAKNLEQL
jgi:hypothetical protein